MGKLNKKILSIHGKAGQSLVEVLVAVFIFMTVMGAVTVILYSGQSSSVDAENSGSATEYMMEGREAVRSIRNQSWASLTDGVHGLNYSGGIWNFSASSDNRDIFTRKVEVATLDSNTKIATTTITWTTDPSRPQKTVVVEQFTHWDNPTQGVCKIGPLTGNWANPQVLGSADLGSGISGTDIVAKLPYVYMSGISSTSAKKDVFVFDVSNPASPTLTASLDIGSGGINSLFLKGNYLYAASPNDSLELIVFDISTPGSISKIGSYNLSGGGDGLSVYAFSNTVAIGRNGAATNELAFLNVTNPASPSLISEISTGGSIYDFTASGDKLYLASQESDPDIWVYSIANPLSPSFVTNYDIPGTTEDVSIFIQESQTGTTSFSILDGNIQNELIVIGATTTLASGWYVRDRLDLAGDVNDIMCVEGNLAFLATTNSNKEFAIVNISNPANIVEYASLNFPQMGTGIDFADNKVFMSVRSNDALRIITSGP